jgi:hypothetical protein
MDKKKLSTKEMVWLHLAGLLKAAMLAYYDTLETARRRREDIRPEKIAHLAAGSLATAIELMDIIDYAKAKKNMTKENLLRCVRKTGVDIKEQLGIKHGIKQKTKTKIKIIESDGPLPEDILRTLPPDLRRRIESITEEIEHSN